MKSFVGYFTLLFFFTGCANLTNVSYYDQTTYKNLTELKPQILFLYEDFQQYELPKAEVRVVKLRLLQAYEYEQGKGSDNNLTVSQFKNIKSIFDRHLALRMNNGKWSKAVFENASENITEAFDIAIKTESSKNNFK